MEIKNELALQEKEEAIAARKRFESTMTNIWGQSILGMEAKNAAMSMLSTKTGLYAKIPITCKSNECPYSETCTLLPNGLAPFGDKCPWEIALIESRCVGYLDDYDLDRSSFTDNTLVAELVNIDVMLERTKALMAKEANPIIDVVAGMTESGEEFTRPEVSKAYEIYERNLNRKERILDMLLGTRKSRKGIESNDNQVMEIFQTAIHDTDFVIEERPDDLN